MRGPSNDASLAYLTRATQLLQMLLMRGFVWGDLNEGDVIMSVCIAVADDVMLLLHYVAISMLMRCGSITKKPTPFGGECVCPPE